MKAVAAYDVTYNFSDSRYLSIAIAPNQTTQAIYQAYRKMLHNLTLMKILGKIATLCVLFYCALWFVTAGIEWHYAAQQGKTHNLFSDTSIYINTPQKAAYGLDKIGDYPKQIYILGGSVAGSGFLQDQIMEKFPMYHIHNLAVAASNVTQMKQVAYLIEERTSLPSLKSAVFVICGHFASFVSNDKLYGSTITPIQRELIRNKMFKLDGEFVNPILDETLSPILIKCLMKPLYFVKTTKHRLVNKLKPLKNWAKRLALIKTSSDPTVAQVRPGVPHKLQDEGYSDEEFDQFRLLVEYLKGQSAKVLFVDTPVSPEYTDQSAVYSAYKTRINDLLDELAISHTDMSLNSPESDFTDGMHPTPPASVKWTKSLIEFLRPQLPDGKS